MNQRGFYDFDVIGFMWFCVIVGVIIGITLSWAWPFLKSWLHALTA